MVLAVMQVMESVDTVRSDHGAASPVEEILRALAVALAELLQSDHPHQNDYLGDGGAGGGKEHKGAAENEISDANQAWSLGSLLPFVTVMETCHSLAPEEASIKTTFWFDR